MQITPYLYFDGRRDVALAFHHSTPGAEPGMVTLIGDAPGAAGGVAAR